MPHSPDPSQDPTPTQDSAPSHDPVLSPRRSRARMTVVPQGDGAPGTEAVPRTAPDAATRAAPNAATRAVPSAVPDLIPAVLPDPAVARIAVQSTATFAERLAGLSLDALADSHALARRWASETTERLLLLARPPERPEDVMHAMAGFLAAQGDLATSQVGRAMALAQKVQVETIGLAAEAGQALAQETAAAMHRATTRTGAARG